MASREYMEALEENLHEVIRTLEGERYFQFTRGLLELLDCAKHSHRNERFMLDGVVGVPLDESQARWREAIDNNTW